MPKAFFGNRRLRSLAVRLYLYFLHIWMLKCLENGNKIGINTYFLRLPLFDTMTKTSHFPETLYNSSI
jgi:hypothetical protein